MVSSPYIPERELSPHFIYQMEGIFPPSLLPTTTSYFAASNPNSTPALTPQVHSYYNTAASSTASNFFRPYAIPSRIANSNQARQNSSASQESQEPSFLRKRNERERQRVKCVNEGYTRLRNHLPSELAEKRLSKVETLRAAIKYIEYLQQLLAEDANQENSKTVCEKMECYPDDNEKENNATKVETGKDSPARSNSAPVKFGSASLKHEQEKTRASETFNVNDLLEQNSKSPLITKKEPSEL